MRPDATRKDLILHLISYCRNDSSVNIEEMNKDEVKDVDASKVVENKTDENLMPVFSEWTQQKQEAEKKLVELNSNTSDLSRKDSKNETTQSKQPIAKSRLKNYSSPQCGAKILSSSPESQSTSSVLNDKDEYMLSPCTEKIWFVVELCEAIQASKVELANTELFSSPLKEVTLSVSSRFPTREWTTLGRYQTKNERDVQVFELESSIFGKFVRVELSYTNTEHFCPLSFFRIFGTSEIEAFEVDNEPVEHRHDEPDDEVVNVGEKKPGNILDRAGAAVLQIVAKAAEALSKNGNGNSTSSLAKRDSSSTKCISLSYELMCHQCPNDDRKQLEMLLTCKDHVLAELLDDRDVKDYLISSNICLETLGSSLKANNIIKSRLNFVTSILPPRYLAAMCHLVAKDQKSLVPKLSLDPAPLDNKKDELSLKNVSNSQNEDCKHPETTSENNSLLSAPNAISEDSKDQKSTESGEQAKLNELNIFNVNNEKNNDVVKVNEENGNSDEKLLSESTEGVEETTTPTPITSTEVNQATTNRIESETTTKLITKQENVEYMKIPPLSSANHPESVFLRLSNRIKILERNMTLSTQYLEELSKRYKKQIEELQQAFNKLLSTTDQEVAKRAELDEKTEQMKASTQNNLTYLNEKSRLVEITVGVLVLVIIVQMFIIFMIYRHIAVLSRKLEELRPHLEKQVSSSQMIIASKKRQRNRVRKISAPNILSQKYSSPKNDGMFHVVRTSSVPKMHLTENRESKENLAPTDLKEIEARTRLEENDEILIPGFEDLTLNEDKNPNLETASNDIDLLKHRASLDEGAMQQFHSRNNSLNLDTRNKQKILLHKKAMSESPPNIHQKLTENPESQSLRSQENGSIVTFKKSNSLKKLFKKIF